MNVKSPSAMPVISSENVKIMVSAPLCEPPVLTEVEVMTTVGSVRSCVKVNWVAAAVLSLPARSVIAPTPTSMVTASSASVGVNVYVQIVFDPAPEPLPLPTDPPARDSVGASSSCSEAVTTTEYVAAVPY